MKKTLIILSALLFCGNTFAQSISYYGIYSPRKIETPGHEYYASQTSGRVYTFSVIFASIIYLLDPIIMYENNKINLGINKEFSVGFGNFGEHRISFDYAYIFRKDNSQHVRAGYKYDLLLSDLKPSNSLQASSAFTFGLSYFTDFTRSGASPEAGFGYSIRNHKFLIYPNLKFRYTYIFEKGKTNAFDFSFGVMIGIANPFIDKKIRVRDR
ncbi:MAG: hypothetical protein LWX07_12595 [Bacteroidetes bacterium]|nr:hypothetical protein [Bacteroidota bacterium]